MSQLKFLTTTLLYNMVRTKRQLNTGPVKKPRNPPEGRLRKPRKPYRNRPGTVALRQIQKYQKSTELLNPKTSVPTSCP